MAYNNVQDIITDINLKIKSNGNKEINAVQLNAILVGICAFITPSLQQQLLAKLGTDGSVGGINTGKNYAIGTTLETILRDLLTKVVHPIYVPPVLSITSDLTQFEHESGTLISPTFTANFTQNDAGSSTSKVLKRNGTQVGSNFPILESPYNIPDGDTVYEGTFFFSAGAVKNNNLGNPDPVGQIQSGSVTSNIITYKGLRKAFYSTTQDVPTTSTQVRGLSNSVLGVSSETEFIIKTLVGAPRIIICFPKTLTLDYCVPIEVGSDIKRIFNEQTIEVEGVNGYQAIEYRVLSYTPIEPFTQATSYKVKLKSA